MSLASTFYDLAYRRGSPRWETETPTPEVVEVASHRPPGLALDLGFSDHSHFTNAFREEFGAPPSAFRRVLTAGRG